jgi:signal transduction histidine kinase
MAIAGITFIIYSVFRVERRLQNLQIALLIGGIVLCGLGLYWWIKKESIDTLKEKQSENRNASLQAELEQVTATCLELEKTLHTDSKKLPAYREAVKRAITMSSETAKLNTLNLLITAQSEMSELNEKVQTTGKHLIDVNLHHNNMRCNKCGILFESFVTKVTAAIKESQIETLIANLVDNAINSHDNSDNQENYITVLFFADRLTVKDNGKPFSESVLADMARCKETLTPNRGNGVGIGFVTIFEITNECGASVEIIQNNSEKSVTVQFDGENRLVTVNNIWEGI